MNPIKARDNFPGQDPEEPMVLDTKDVKSKMKFQLDLKKDLSDDQKSVEGAKTSADDSHLYKP